MNAQIDPNTHSNAIQYFVMSQMGSKKNWASI